MVSPFIADGISFFFCALFLYRCFLSVTAVHIIIRQMKSSLRMSFNAINESKTNGNEKKNLWHHTI
jgi:hypothetical protein